MSWSALAMSLRYWTSAIRRSVSIAYASMGLCSWSSFAWCKYSSAVSYLGTHPYYWTTVPAGGNVAKQLSKCHTRHMDTVQQQRNQQPDNRQLTDQLRILATEYVITFNGDTAGEIVLKSRHGQNMTPAVDYLRADGYTVEDSGQGTITVHV